MKPRVLLTGAAGGVGSIVRERLGDRWDLVCLDRRPVEGVPGSIVADLTDGAALERAARGCSAIVHLGAHPNPADFMSVILPNNIVGTFRLFEAAVRAGVTRVVFASSVQVERNSQPGDRVSVEEAPEPRNVYAASKTFGENLGHVYHHQHGLEVVCLRPGLVATPGRVAFLHGSRNLPGRLVLTARDCAGIVARAVETPGIGYAVLPAYSRNAADVRDLESLRRVLGYEPEEDAFVLWPRRTDWNRHWLRSRWFRLRMRLRMRAAGWRGRLRRGLAGGRPVRRVLVTGAAGYVGTAFRRDAAGRFDLAGFDRRPAPGVTVGDLADRGALVRAMRGCDAVLHLGGIRDEADFETELLPHNIIGTWNVYQAAAAAGVRRVVFASTVQAEDGYPRSGPPVSVRRPARPLNMYAVSKVLGEDLGRSLAFRGGPSVIALRLGWVRVPDDPEWTRMAGRRPPLITLTERDACEIFSRALTVPDVRFALLPAYSRSAAGIKDLAPLKDVLDYEPQDDPVEDFMRKEGAQPDR